MREHFSTLAPTTGVELINPMLTLTTPECRKLRREQAQRSCASSSIFMLQPTTTEPVAQRTYFGLQVIDGRYVLQSEIAQLPFFDFWRQSSRSSTCLGTPNGDVLVFLYDWEAFARLFIETGRHRYQKTKL